MRFTKDDITSLFRRLLESKDNFALFMLVYAPRIAIAAALIMVLKYCCIWLELPYRYTSPVLRVILSVLPLYPTLSVWKCRDDFGGESGVTDGIMDACFAIWAIIIFYAWSVN